jgi:hypothetical protein
MRCETPTSSLYTRIKATKETATTIVAYRFSTLPAKLLPVFSILLRLQILAEKVLPESQCGFRSKRSTIDIIFSLRQIQEKCHEQQMPLYIAFVDLTKAFDTVSRPGLFQVLEAIGCMPS